MNIANHHFLGLPAAKPRVWIDLSCAASKRAGLAMHMPGRDVLKWAVRILGWFAWLPIEKIARSPIKRFDELDGHEMIERAVDDLAAKNAKIAKIKMIGVHVRRTDYREWQGGKYCYPNSVYERVIDEVKGLIDGVRVAVFTDEPESLSPQLSQFNSQPTTPERDQWLMSKCAYLIGPPSTFTAWASFMGKVPLLHLKNGKQNVRLCDFKMIW